MKNKHYAILKEYFEEGKSTINNGIKSAYYANSMDKARETLEREYNKTIQYAKKRNINTADENNFSPFINKKEGFYEISADGYFFETGEIMELED